MHAPALSQVKEELAASLVRLTGCCTIRLEEVHLCYAWLGHGCGSDSVAASEWVSSRLCTFLTVCRRLCKSVFLLVAQ